MYMVELIQSSKGEEGTVAVPGRATKQVRLSLEPRPSLSFLLCRAPPPQSPGATFPLGPYQVPLRRIHNSQNPP